MEENNPERLVVVTSTPEGVAPLTPGERSMMEEEPDQVEQAVVVSHSFPKLAPGPALAFFEQARKAFSESDAMGTIWFAGETLKLEPNYLPAHLYEELGMNIARRRDLKKCVQKITETISLSQEMLKGRADPAGTEFPVQPEHINELMDIARYNLSDRYMRLGKYVEALEQLRLSEMLPKSLEPKMKRRLKEASLLYRLNDKEGCLAKLKLARDMDRELFGLLRERMSLDGHVGVDQRI